LPKSAGVESGNANTDQENKTLSKTGKFVLPEITMPDSQIIYMLSIALACFAGVFILKKLKKSKANKSGNENEITNAFSEIKLQIRGEKKGQKPE